MMAKHQREVAGAQDPQYPRLEGMDAGAALVVGQAPGATLNGTAASPQLAVAGGRGILAQLAKVRTCGYSLALVAKPEVLERHRAAVSAFELSDRLPRKSER